MLFFEEIEESGVLVLSQQRHDLHLFFQGISALDMLEAAAAFEGVQDIPADLLVILADYADALALVESVGEIVDRYAVDPGADKADDDHAERIDGKCGAADQGSCDGDGCTYVEVQILVDYLGEDVEASCRGVYPEQNGLGNAEHQHEADEVQSWIVHYGRTLGNKFLIGEYLVPYIYQRAEDKRRINGFDAEFSTYEQPCEHEQ